MPAARTTIVCEVVDVVVLEPRDEPEAVSQRPGDEPGAGGGADEREPWEVEADRPGRRALAEDDVELEILHRRIEHLFDRACQPVDLVDEEHVAFVEVGQHRGEITGSLDGRARRDVEAHTELDGDDVGERGLAQARRTGEQQVVGSLAASPCGLEDDREMLLELGLADEVLQLPRPQTAVLDDLLTGDRFGLQQLFAHASGSYRRTSASRCSACLNSSATSPSSGTSASASRISSGS